MTCPEEPFQCLNRLCIFCGQVEWDPDAESEFLGFSALTGFVSSVGIEILPPSNGMDLAGFSALTGFVSSVGDSHITGLKDLHAGFSALTGFVSSVGKMPKPTWQKA